MNKNVFIIEIGETDDELSYDYMSFSWAVTYGLCNESKHNKTFY